MRSTDLENVDHDKLRSARMSRNRNPSSDGKQRPCARESVEANDRSRAGSSFSESRRR